MRIDRAVVDRAGRAPVVAGALGVDAVTLDPGQVAGVRYSRSGDYWDFDDGATAVRVDIGRPGACTYRVEGAGSGERTSLDVGGAILQQKAFLIGFDRDSWRVSTCSTARRNTSRTRRWRASSAWPWAPAPRSSTSPAWTAKGLGAGDLVAACETPAPDEPQSSCWCGIIPL